MSSSTYSSADTHARKYQYVSSSLSARVFSSARPRFVYLQVQTQQDGWVVVKLGQNSAREAGLEGSRRRFPCAYYPPSFRPRVVTMGRDRMATAAANSWMTGSPPKKQHQNAPGSMPGVPTAPEIQKIDIEEFECPGKCGYARTWTHQTHCCTGCSRDQPHTNNCEHKVWKGRKMDASSIKIQQLSARLRPARCLLAAPSRLRASPQEARRPESYLRVAARASRPAPPEASRSQPTAATRAPCGAPGAAENFVRGCG